MLFRSLPWMEKSWASGILGKIPRLLTQKLLASVEQVIDDNQALLALFQKMLPQGAPMPAKLLGRGKIPWFDSVYEGRLGEQDLFELGMLPCT